MEQQTNNHFSLNQKRLDTLRALNNKNQIREDFKTVRGNITFNTTEKELTLILNKLIKDGHVEQLGGSGNLYSYTITHEGIIYSNSQKNYGTKVVFWIKKPGNMWKVLTPIITFILGVIAEWLKCKC